MCQPMKTTHLYISLHRVQIRTHLIYFHIFLYILPLRVVIGWFLYILPLQATNIWKTGIPGTHGIDFICNNIFHFWFAFINIDRYLTVLYVFVSGFIYVCQLITARWYVELWCNILVNWVKFKIYNSLEYIWHHKYYYICNRKYFNNCVNILINFNDCVNILMTA